MTIASRFALQSEDGRYVTYDFAPCAAYLAGKAVAYVYPTREAAQAAVAFFGTLGALTVVQL